MTTNGNVRFAGKAAFVTGAGSGIDAPRRSRSHAKAPVSSPPTAPRSTSARPSD